MMLAQFCRDFGIEPPGEDLGARIMMEPWIFLGRNSQDLYAVASRTPDVERWLARYMRVAPGLPYWIMDRRGYQQLNSLWSRVHE